MAESDRAAMNGAPEDALTHAERTVAAGQATARPAYRLLVELAARYAGPGAVAMLSAYRVCGSRRALRHRAVDWVGGAVHPDPVGDRPVDSIDEFVAVEV